LFVGIVLYLLALAASFHERGGTGMTGTYVYKLQPVEHSTYHLKHFFMAYTRQQRVSIRTTKENHENIFDKSIHK
jgi:hypothetical protein